MGCIHELLWLPISPLPYVFYVHPVQLSMSILIILFFNNSNIFFMRNLRNLMFFTLEGKLELFFRGKWIHQCRK